MRPEDTDTGDGRYGSVSDRDDLGGKQTKLPGRLTDSTDMSGAEGGVIPSIGEHPLESGVPVRKWFVEDRGEEGRRDKCPSEGAGGDTSREAH